MRVIAAAYNTNEFADASPAYVELVITPTLFATLMELRALTRAHDLDIVSKAHDIHWVGIHPDTTRTWNDCLEVTTNGFFVSAFVKHQDLGHLECRVVYWTAFDAAYASGSDLYVADGDEEGFKAAVMDATHADNAEALPA